jgi:hypothetical protein
LSEENEEIRSEENEAIKREENEAIKREENEKIKDGAGGLRQHLPQGAHHAENVTYSPTIISTPRFSKLIFSHVPGTPFPIYRHRGFHRAPLGIGGWGLGFCNHPPSVG